MFADFLPVFRMNFPETVDQSPNSSLAAQQPGIAGRLVLGREFASRATDLESAKADVLARAPTIVEAEYWKYTKIPSQLANKYYDEITDHGVNGTNCVRAVQEAIERYELRLP